MRLCNLFRRKKIWVGSGKEWRLHVIHTDPNGNKYISRYGYPDEAWFLGPNGSIIGSNVFKWKPYEKEET